MAVQNVSTSLWETVREFRKRSVGLPLVLMMFVMFFQQAGGLNALASFAASLFQQAGVANPRITTAYAMGGVELATSLVVVFVIDLVGRKFLLILSGVGMSIGTLLLGVHFYLTRPSLCASERSFNSTLSLELSEDSGANVCNAQYGPLAIVSIMTFGVGFSIGWGPIPWILVSELTPLRVRGAAAGIATLVNWGTAAVVVGFYSSYAEAVTTWFAWWSFTAINIAAVVFAALFLRETKGKSLEEIESHYQRNVL
jgi:SP family facilitated glucose transporter-like MFS transporter 8